jgi:ABC-type branched-subunit amino acid transport system ATPase component
VSVTEPNEKQSALFTPLRKNFGRFAALRRLSFDVPEGSAFAMIRTNGAGQNTAIEINAGLGIAITIRL